MVCSGLLQILFIVKLLSWMTCEACKCEESDTAFCYKGVAPDADTVCYKGLKCDCGSNNLTVFPNATLIPKPDEVVWLNLVDNSLANITRWDLGEFTSLLFLDLTGNPIQHVGSKTFLNSSNLIELRVQTDNLKYNSLRGMRSLRKLEINGNGVLPELPTKVMSHLKALEHLVITDTAVRRLPENFMDGYQELLVLDMRNNHLDSIDAGAFNNTPNLTELHLSKNHIKTIHHSIIKHASKLKIFDTSYNDLETLDKDFLDNINELELLDLSHNKITNLTIDTHVLNVDLSSNSFTKAEDIHITNTSWIQNLNIANNSITKLTRFYHIDKESIPSKYAGKQQKIDCSYNNLQVIESNVFESFYQLRKLDLEGNSLSNIDHLVLPRELRRLHLADNNFTRFPNIINGFKQMRWLDLSKNDLQNIPADIFYDFKDLRYLNLKGNRLTDLPNDLLTGTKVTEYLDLSDNPLLCTCAVRDILKLKTSENTTILGGCIKNSTHPINLNDFKEMALCKETQVNTTSTTPTTTKTTQNSTLGGSTTEDKSPATNATTPTNSPTKDKLPATNATTPTNSPTKDKLPATEVTTTKSYQKELTTSIVFNAILALVIIVLVIIIVVLYGKYKKVYTLNAYHTKKDTIRMENAYENKTAPEN